MSHSQVFGLCPGSVSFSLKILQIPTLEEMGIALAGLGLATLHQDLVQGRYYPDPSRCWINRGDPLLTYTFRFFAKPNKPLFGDPTWHKDFVISSPISGLLLTTRQEETIGYAPGISLQYQWCKERLLPVILVPNDEPPPDRRNFYIYDEIAQVLAAQFNLIPIRDPSKTSPERLRSWLDRGGEEKARHYNGIQAALQNRDNESYRTYTIREITKSDRELVESIQYLRTKDLSLRDKLVHIARTCGEAI